MVKNLDVTVKKEYLDRYTGLKRKVGDKMTITDDRHREIRRSGDYVEINTPAEAAPAAKK